jgi:hypothetical protein
VYLPPPPLMTIELKSETARLYPYVEEFAMLSEIVARRLALAASPATLAFKEEEIVIGLAFLSQVSTCLGQTYRLEP